MNLALIYLYNYKNGYHVHGAYNVPLTHICPLSPYGHLVRFTDHPILWRGSISTGQSGDLYKAPGG